MSPVQASAAPRKPLRLWPGIVLAIVMVLARFVMPTIVPNTGILGVLAGVAGFVLILLWWLFFSRAAWVDRIAALVVIVAGVAAGYAFAGIAASAFQGVQLPGALPLIFAAAVPIVAAVLASLVPAARAARVDVLQALRSE